MLASRGANDRGDLFVFVGMVLVWGSSFLLIKVSLEGLGPAQVALVRSVLGALTLLAVLALTGQALPREPRLWGHMTVIGLTQCAVPFSLTAWVGLHLPSSVSSIYNAAAPTMTVVLTPLLLRHERLSRSQVVGVVVGVAGVMVLMAPWRQAASLDGTSAAQLGMLLSATVYGFGLVYMRRFVASTPHGGIPIATMQVLITATCLLAVAPFTARGAVRLSPSVLVSVLLLGMVGTGVAYVWSARIIRAWGATRASTVTYLMPLVGVALGVCLLGERLAPNEPLGGAVILLGILIARRSGQAAAPSPGAVP